MAADARRPPLDALLAVAVVSFSILAAEIALTRIFSVLFRAPYVFLIVSGAIGGLGLGGIIVQLLPLRAERLPTWLAGLTAALSLALAAPVLLLFVSPWGRELVSEAETAVVVTLPMATFCVAGMALALLFRQYAGWGGTLYFVDLAAAALAAPAAVLLLDRVGGINAPLALATAVAAVAALLAVRARRTALLAAAGALCLAGAVLLGTNLASPWIDLPPLKKPFKALDDPTHPWYTLTKPLFADLADPAGAPKLVRTDWTAVSRTDVAADPSQDGYYVYTDGDVPTQMVPWDGTIESARREYEHFIGWLPFRLAGAPPERVMSIGSGGGLDILLALAAGARRVDAVEINPAIPRVVADPRFRHTYAATYRDPRVHLVVDEGRSVLQRSGRYDVIYFACAKTATTQTGGTALLDNHLYTTQAFRTYWDHLAPDGVLALVTQEGFLIDRLLITALEALREEGVPAAEGGAHLLTAQVPEERFAYGPYRFILLLRRRAWTPAEAASLPAALRENHLLPLYLPFVQPRGSLGAAIDPAGDLAAMQRTVERQYPINADSSGGSRGETRYPNLAPVRDDSPFYVDVAPGLHPAVAQLLWGAAIATAVVLLLAALLGYRALRKQQPPAGEASAGDSAGRDGQRVAAAVLYFAMLGSGFMLVELALLQWFILLLGFPTRSLTVTLFALLLSSALGSSLTQRGSRADAARRLGGALPALVALLLLYRLGLPPLLDALLPLPLAGRVAATALILLPAGLLMGMPFATALRLLEGRAAALIPAMWSVNGVTSILGSVAAMALAKFVGYSGVLIAGALCYAAAAAAFAGLRRAVSTAGEDASGPEPASASPSAH